MNDATTYPITAITIDPKKNRIRVYKSTLNALDKPPYIQFLVNPTQKLVALLALEEANSSNQLQKIDWTDSTLENSFEIYSKPLVQNIFEILDGLDDTFAYRITGKIIPDKKIAIFALNTTTRIEN